MIFPFSPRYSLASKKAVDFIFQEEIKHFPINPFEIIKNNKWGLITYSQLAEENNITIKQVIQGCQSKDGYVIFDEENYTIAYNDLVPYKNRIRFTLMHEIGHIYLNHLIDFDETIIRRSELTKNKYTILENEANHFARNVLSPAPVVNKLNISSENDIIYYFQITGSAAKTRLDLLKTDSKLIMYLTSKLWKYFDHFFHVSHNTKFCTKCKHFFINKDAKYCPICGYSRLSKRKGANAVKYGGYDLDENGRPSICPRCENEDISDNDEFCKICAMQLVNKCTAHSYDGFTHEEWECGTIASGNARYCVKCGEQTTYFKQGLLNDWETEINNDLSELKNKKRSVSVMLDDSDLPF